jgi:hypothetical protein
MPEKLEPPAEAGFYYLLDGFGDEVIGQWISELQHFLVLGYSYPISIGMSELSLIGHRVPTQREAIMHASHSAFMLACTRSSHAIGPGRYAGFEAAEAYNATHPLLWDSFESRPLEEDEC